MAPLSTPLILSTVSPFCRSHFPSSTDCGSSLTRGRRYNYGRWEGFKYSCFHYGAGLLLARPAREEEEILFFKNNVFLHRSSPAILFQLLALRAVSCRRLLDAPYTIDPNRSPTNQYLCFRKGLLQVFKMFRRD